ncbi:MAG TPA: DUF87 domain-containing protein [Chitinophagaceae bacterium]|nr:DUF87 domain-containing protein [Chitinophagaceae bacterium]
MSKVKQIVDNLERIGTIGSPSTTTELTLDILGKAVNKKLVGELALFDFVQDGKEHVALGQITDIELRNSWLEDPTMRSLARQRGQVNPVSGQQDVHLGDMSVSAVFAEEDSHYEPSMLGTVPQTGTYIKLADDNVINTLLERQQQEIFYLGNVYGSNPLLPMWFKHFDISSKEFQGGAGEAYHLGIFGKSGSGKSVLAKTMILGYSQHKNMGIFILDPQGEFSKDLRKKDVKTEIGNILNRHTLTKSDRNPIVFDLTNILLDSWDLFFQLLIEFKFFFDLGIKNINYQDSASDYLIDFCQDSKKIKLEAINLEALKLCLEHLEKNIAKIYAGKDAAGTVRVTENITEVLSALSNNESHKVVKTWEKILKFFEADSKKRTPWQIINYVVTAKDNRPLVSIDLSAPPDGVSQYTWDEDIKPLITYSFLSVINTVAEKAYKDEKSLNTLVVIDEAHRLAPRGKIEKEKKDKIRNRLIDAVRTTRKYGLGWLFISQTLSSLDKDIIDQLRINFFGFGLSMGSEFQALRELAGGEQKSLKLYQSFRDPHSAFSESSRQYSFMTVGPISPLSFSGTPLFFTAFNSAEQFLKVNKL